MAVIIKKILSGKAELLGSDSPRLQFLVSVIFPFKNSELRLAASSR